jgi:hypothetical protein
MSNRDFELEFSRPQDISIVTEYSYFEVGADPTYETPVQHIMRQMAAEPCRHDDLEGWCDLCAQYLGPYCCRCLDCRPYATRACVKCGAVEQPDGAFLL